MQQFQVHILKQFLWIFWQILLLFIIQIDKTIFFFQIFNDITGKYWSPERKLVDEAYQTIPKYPYSDFER